MCGTILIGVYILVIYIRALRNDGRLQELFISETDERNILIRSKTGGMAINIIMAALALATIISGIFNEVVYFTLLITLLFVVLFKGTLKLYYRKKI
jgi:Kef-type K+ transport system membrane component KefB